MSHEHWFDTLNRSLVRPAPRRVLLRLAAALVAGAVLGGRRPSTIVTVGAAAERCARRACRRHPWPQQTEEDDRDFCEVKCGRCKKAGTAFCIHRADNHHDEDHATCCRRSEKCCPETFYCCPKEYSCCKDPTKPFPCCPLGRECCSGDPDGCCGEGEKCCDIDLGKACVPRDKCCPDDTVTGWCGPDEDCCPGVGCRPRGECRCRDHGQERRRAAADDGCGDECPTGQQRCFGACVDPQTNPINCGGCNRQCVTGQDCVDGECRCRDNIPDLCERPTPRGVAQFCTNLDEDQRNCGTCGHNCNLEGGFCCGGACVDTISDPNNCRFCGRVCPVGGGCCAGSCYDASQECCADGDARRICRSGRCCTRPTEHWGAVATTRTGRASNGPGSLTLARTRPSWRPVRTTRPPRPRWVDAYGQSKEHWRSEVTS